MSTISLGLQLIANSVSDLSEGRMLRRWQKEYDAFAQRRSRQQKIITAITEGYDTIREIAAETGIPYPTVRRMLLEMTTRKRVVATLVKKPRRGGSELRYQLEMSAE